MNTAFNTEATAMIASTSTDSATVETFNLTKGFTSVKAVNDLSEYRVD